MLLWFVAFMAWVGLVFAPRVAADMGIPAVLETASFLRIEIVATLFVSFQFFGGPFLGAPSQVRCQFFVKCRDLLFEPRHCG